MISRAYKLNSRALFSWHHACNITFHHLQHTAIKPHLTRINKMIRVTTFEGINKDFDGSLEDFEIDQSETYNAIIEILYDKEDNRYLAVDAEELQILTEQAIEEFS